MASLIREMIIDVDPAQAWEALADFGHVDTRLAGGVVTSCIEDDPCVRTLTFFTGDVAREVLVGVDATARRLAYTVTDGPLGATHHNAAAQIVDEGGRTRFLWVTDVLPDELTDALGPLMAAASRPSRPRSNDPTSSRDEEGAPEKLLRVRRLGGFRILVDIETLDDRQRQLCDDNPYDFGGLSALFVNCTLKPSPEQSHTEGLAHIAVTVMQANGVSVEMVRAVDWDLPPGVQPDMTEHGAATDAWPELYAKVMAADVLVLMTPIWLGEKSSVCTRVIERLYGSSAVLNDAGQNAYYGRVGGCLVTGNEDGAKHCAMNVLYSLQHLGFAIPPQADAAWLGEAGPGPSYLDPGSGGPDNDFTNRNTTFMAWNLMHLARLLRDAGGFPAHGNQRAAWAAGCRFDFPNPEHR